MNFFFLTLTIALVNAQHDFLDDVAEGMYESHEWGLAGDLDENQTYALTIICGTILATFFGTLLVAKVIDNCIDDNDW